MSVKVAWVAMLIVAGGLLGGCNQRPFSPNMLGDNARKGYELLLTCETLAGTTVGEGGGPSAEADAFAAIHEDKNAAPAFRSLLENATLPGQLYALCYLRKADRHAYATALPKYRSITTEIPTIDGSCFVFHRRVCDIVDDSLDQSPQRDTEPHPAKELDIVSGYWTGMLWYHRSPARIAEENRRWVASLLGMDLPAGVQIIYAGHREEDRRGPFGGSLPEFGSAAVTLDKAIVEALNKRSIGDGGKTARRVWDMEFPFEGETEAVGLRRLPPVRLKDGSTREVEYGVSPDGTTLFIWMIVNPPSN